MAFKKSTLSQIPERNKDLAFGYVHEKEKANKMSVPEMIKYLCLIYFNPTDAFDPEQCHEKIQINGNCIIKIPNSDEIARNVYLKNDVSSGVHLWKFKCNGTYEESEMFPDMIGISNKAQYSKHRGCYFDGDFDQPWISVGYGFTSKGKLTNEKYPRQWGRQYGTAWKQGDEIGMKLDFNAKNLQFKVNEIDYGVAFKIDAKKKWKAAISIRRGKFELISYQQLY